MSDRNETTRVILLVGMPFSGKTSFALRLQQLGWLRYSMAMNASMAHCEHDIKNLALQGAEIVIDEYNHTINERKFWLDILSRIQNIRFNIIACVFCVPTWECMERGAEIYKKNFDSRILKWYTEENNSVKISEGFHRILNITGGIKDSTIDILGPAKQIRYNSGRVKRIDFSDGSKKVLPLEQKSHGRSSGLIKRDKIILLFDLNGTLLHRNKSSKTAHIRPGINNLLKLKDKFAFGIFTSCYQTSVDHLYEKLVNEIGEDIFDKELILTRDHTIRADRKRGSESKSWDTQKPLRDKFGNLHRVILLDDSEYKSFRGESKNMILVPTWLNMDPHDSVLERLTNILLDTFNEAGNDVDIVLQLIIHYSTVLCKMVHESTEPIKAGIPKDTSPKKERAVVILPGLGNASGDYTEFAEDLSAFGLETTICPVRRVDWLRNAAGLRDINYWRGTLKPRPTVDWFLLKVEETVDSIKRATDGLPITILAHSAGGWLARLYLKDFGTTGIDQLITLGSPHLPPPLGTKGVIDQTRGILYYCDNEIPGAYYSQVSYVTVAGRYIKGSRFDGTGTLNEKLVGLGYKQVCGEAEVWGDGITPIPSAHLPGAKTIDLDNVYHSPVGAVRSSTDQNKQNRKTSPVWYGSRDVMDKWIDEITKNN